MGKVHIQKMATHHEQPIFVNLKSNTYEKNTIQRYLFADN